MKFSKHSFVIVSICLAIIAAMPGLGFAYTFSLEVADKDNNPKSVFLPEEIVRVNIILDDRSQVAGCALTLNYDPAILTPPTTSADAVAVPTGDVTFALVNAGNLNFKVAHRENAAEPGKVYLSGVALNTNDGGAHPDPQQVELFSVYFTVRNNVFLGATFNFSITQSELFNPDAGYGTDINGNGIFDAGTDTRGKLPVLIGTVNNADPHWSDLNLAFPVLLSDATTPVFATVQSTQLEIVDPFLTIPALPQGYTDGQPDTYPLLTLGQTATLAVSDPTRQYDWSARDWEGNTVAGVSGTGVTAVVLNPDLLFDSRGAGVYKITVVDSGIPTRSFVFYVRVPMKITPLEGNHESGDAPATFRVFGGPGANVYEYSAVDEQGQVVTAAECGVFAVAGATGTANNFDFTANIPALKTFQVVVTLDDTQGDPDVTRLKAAALDIVKTLYHRVVPVLVYGGTVVSDSGLPLANGKITAKHKQSIATEIQAADGSFDFSDATANDSGQAESFRKIPGVIYRFFVSADNHVDKEVTGDDLNSVVTLEKLPNTDATNGTATLTGDDVPFEDTTAVVISATADGTPILDNDGQPVRTLVNPTDGSYSLPVPLAYVGAGVAYTLTAHKKGYHDESSAITGPLPQTVNLTLTPRTIITVSAVPGADTSVPADGVPDSVDVSITAKAGVVTPVLFAGTAGQINVTMGGSPLTLAWDNVNKAWTFNHGTYETFTFTVDVDITEDNDVTTGSPETLVHTYVKASTAPQSQPLTDPVIDGATVTIGNASVNLPPGGLIGEIVDKVFVAVIEANPAAAGIGAVITGSEIVEIIMTDVDGETVSNTNLQRFEITLAFDTTGVPEGALENGQMVIYQADSMAAMVSRSYTPVPASQIILADYVNGQVTFWVDHLSAFGIGAPASGGSSVTAAAGSGGGGGCFIATAAYGSLLEPHVQTLRQFRDVYLLPSKAGQVFVKAYYQYSPPVAAFIAEHDTLRAVVRILLAPAVAAGYMALHTTAAQKAVLMLLVVTLMLVGIFYTARWRRRSVLRNRRPN